MDRIRITVFLVIGALGLVAYNVVPEASTRTLIWVLLLLCTAGAITSGVRRHQPSSRSPWALLITGTMLFVFSSVANLELWVDVSPAVARFGGLGVIVGYPLIGVGAARFANAQSAGRDHGPILDSLIITLAFVSVLWEAVLDHRAIAGGLELHGLAALLVLTASSAWVAAMTVRLVLARAHGVVSGWLMLASAVFGGAGAVSMAWLGFPGGSPTVLTRTLWGAAVLLLGATALHPTMQRLTQPSDIDHAHVITRTVLPSTALLVPPVGMAVRHLTGGNTTMVSIGMSILIAIVVILRFASLVVDRQRAHALVTHQSQHDSLTGLPDRTLLTRRLDMLLREPRGDETDVGVLFVDLDGFKAINDTHGHAAGDEVLVATARRLEACCRDDDLVARFAGDEFVVVLDGVTVETARAAAERIRAAIREDIAIVGSSVRVDASVGLAMADVVGRDLERLLLTADDAMYAAKRAGRGRVHVAIHALAPDAHAGETSAPHEVVIRRA